MNSVNINRSISYLCSGSKPSGLLNLKVSCLVLFLTKHTCTTLVSLGLKPYRIRMRKMLPLTGRYIRERHIATI